MLTIYHNGECSKCRSALEILQERNVPHEVRWYLADPLSKEELDQLLKKLNMLSSQLVRKSEPLYKEQYDDRHMTEADWLEALVNNPILIERPIVEKGDKAIVARPPERVLEMI